MPILVVRDRRDGSSTKIPLTLEKLRIGKKSKNNHLVLSSPSVSRYHCEIVRNNGRYIIRDLGSSNGTFVNGKKVEEAVLSHNAIIQIGDFEILYQEEESSRTPSPPPPPPPPVEKPSTLEVSTPKTPRKKRKKSPIPIEIKRKIHGKLRENKRIRLMDFSQVSEEEARRITKEVVDEILRKMADEIPRNINLRQLVQEILDEALGLGPLEELLADDSISEIMVNNWDTIYVERNGKIELTDLKFTDNEQLIQIIRRILAPLGRRIDESSPLVDARLKDGSRVNAIIPPLAVSGPTLTIRKFPKERLTVDDLIRFGSLTPQMAKFLEICVKHRKNIVISGGTGSGKTTLLNIISLSLIHI